MRVLGNVLRVVALVGALAGTILVVLLKVQPSVLVALDQWLVDRYVASEHWPAECPPETAAQEQLAAAFQERAATIQYGDRHYPAWRQSGAQVARAWAAQKRYAQAAELYHFLIATRPNEFLLRLQRADWLWKAGDPTSLRAAQAEVDTVLRRFPDWQQALDLQSALSSQGAPR